jgi:hypothetical protein
MSSFINSGKLKKKTQYSRMCIHRHRHGSDYDVVVERNFPIRLLSKAACNKLILHFHTIFLLIPYEFKGLPRKLKPLVYLHRAIW